MQIRASFGQLSLAIWTSWDATPAQVPMVAGWSPGFWISSVGIEVLLSRSPARGIARTGDLACEEEEERPLKAAVPGTSSALPHLPFASLTTNAWRTPKAS
jgi:hypothetical protein